MSPSGRHSATSEAWRQLSPLKEGLGRGTVHEGLMVVVGSGYTNKQKRIIFLYFIFLAPGLISCLPFLCPHYGARREGKLMYSLYFHACFFPSPKPSPLLSRFCGNRERGRLIYLFLVYSLWAIFSGVQDGWSFARRFTFVAFCFSFGRCRIEFLWPFESSICLGLWVASTISGLAFCVWMS